MNVYYAILCAVVCGIIGGLAHGVITYGGAILPGRETHDVLLSGQDRKTPVTLVQLGIIGEAFIGLITSLVVLFIYVDPTVVVRGSSVVNVTFYSLGIILVASIGGTAAISQLVDNKQWTKMAPVLAKSMPDEKPLDTSKPIVALRQMALR